MGTAARRARWCVLAALAVASPSPAAAPGGDLAAAFQNPPPTARPHTWWHWMNGNITAEGITADLEAMARVGVGGAQCFNVGAGIEAGPVPYLSDQWKALWAHAVREADRTGVELTFHNCGGWSSSGGPWVRPEHAMQILTFTEVRASGPAPFRAQLEQPDTRLGHYRDIAVLAFPTPPGELVGLREAGPLVTASAGRVDGRLLTDGDPATFVVIPKPTDTPEWLQLEFAEPFCARSLALVDGPGRNGYRGQLQVSDDGREFRDVQAVTGPRTNGPGVVTTQHFEPTTARYWRLTFASADSRATRIALAEVDLHGGARLDGLAGKAGFTTAYDPAPTGAEVPPDQCVPRQSILDLSDRLLADGTLEWDVPDGDWTILRLGHTPTGKNNHPAPAGGEGPEVDKMSREAAEAFWNDGVQPLLDQAGPLVGRALTGTLIDSYEVGCQNWTPRMREEFSQRRGYDILPWLLCVTGRVIDDVTTTERFLWDLRRTLADLYADCYWGYFAERCHAVGMDLWTEPYGNGNFDNLTAGGRADIPMSEFWVGQGLGGGNSKQAASIAHTYGRRYVGAEAFTATDTNGRWQNHPYKLKALGDYMYTAGVNRFVFHRYAHQPWLDRVPGMTMGPWGFHFERTNTWWEQGTAWLEYLARCQHLLQEGTFQADLLYWVGEGSPANGEGIRGPAPPAGYDYDVCDTEILGRLTIENGRLKAPGGTTYAALVLADRPLVTPPALRRIQELVEAGAVIVGPRPERSPSLTDQPGADDEIRELAAAMWGDARQTGVIDRRVGAGRVTWLKPLDELLREVGAEPDVRWAGAAGAVPLHWIHRRLGEAEVYFVATSSPRAEEVSVSFRQTGRRAELWWPDSGRIEPAGVQRVADGRTDVALRLEPTGSVFVVFRGAPGPAVSAIAADGQVLFPPAQGADLGDNNAGVVGSFTLAGWVRPGRGVELPAAGFDGVHFDGQNWVLFPPPGHELYGDGHGSCGLSVGTNGVKVVEHSANYFPNVLVCAADLRDWTHLALVYRDGTPTVYLNGRSVATGRRSPRTIHSGFGVRHSRGFAPFEGQTVGLAQYPEALDDARIAALAAEARPTAVDQSVARVEVVSAADGLRARVWTAGQYDLTVGEATMRLDVPAVPEPLAITTPWRVTFPAARPANLEMDLDRLVSWPTHDHPEVRYYSGSAVYRTEFDVPAELIRGGRALFLDLGGVAVIAEPTLNGQPLGIQWKPPFRAEVTPLLRAGRNTLEVRVTNLWPNRLIGDAALPEAERRTFYTWNHWKAEDPLFESGLLGPVRILAAEERALDR